jgi:hypothetical protein
MREPRLTTTVWVSAVLRQLQANGIFATVLAKGDATAGTVIVACRARTGAINTYARTAAMDGSPAWIRTSKADLDDSQALAAMALARKRDPDLWWVEAELEDITPYLDGPLLGEHKA